MTAEYALIRGAVNIKKKKGFKIMVARAIQCLYKKS